MSHKNLEKQINELSKKIEHFSNVVNNFTGTFNNFGQRFTPFPSPVNGQLANTGAGNGVQVNFGPNGTANIQLANVGNGFGSVPNLLINGQPIGNNDAYYGSSNTIQWPNVSQVGYDYYHPPYPNYYGSGYPVSTPVVYNQTSPYYGGYEPKQRPTIGLSFSLPI